MPSCPFCCFIPTPHHHEQVFLYLFQPYGCSAIWQAARRVDNGEDASMFIWGSRPEPPDFHPEVVGGKASTSLTHPMTPKHVGCLHLERLAKPSPSWQWWQLNFFQHVATGAAQRASSTLPRVNKQLCSASPNSLIAAEVYTATN